MDIVKRGLVGLFILVFCVNVLSAESCSISLREECSYSVMGVANLTNAHGQVWNATEQYDYVVCCDWEETDRACYENGLKVLNLYSQTNSHAESPLLSNYDQSICYGDLNCSLKTEGCSAGEFGILSLSDETNAHIGEFSDYNLKLCCRQVCEGVQNYIDGECIANALTYWANDEKESITTLSAQENEVVYLILKNSYLDAGTPVEIEIIESDFLVNDLIKTVSSEVLEDGSVEINWTLNAEEKANLEANEDDGVFELFFVVSFSEGSEQSTTLHLSFEGLEMCSIIDYCRDYETEESCNSDDCAVAEISVESNNEYVQCGASSYNEEIQCSEVQGCGCAWDEGKDQCVPVLEYLIQNCNGTGLETPFSVGVCSYSENSQDDCSDGFLTYSWDSEWEWGGENNFGNEDLGYEDYHLVDGIYRYDPKDDFGVRKSEKCQDGTTVISCPMSVQLSFFDNISFAWSVILIGIVYLFYIKRR